MNFRIFQNKLKVTTEIDTEEFVDLSGKTVEFPREPTLQDLLQVDYEVQEYEKQRPDLISWKFYNTVDNADFIMKLNGISNPYSIHKGMVLRIPTERFITISLKKPQSFDDNEEIKLQRGDIANINRQYQLPKNEKGKKRLDFLKSKYKKGQFLPPSLRTLQEADTQSTNTAKDRRTIKETLNLKSRITNR